MCLTTAGIDLSDLFGLSDGPMHQQKLEAGGSQAMFLEATGAAGGGSCVVRGMLVLFFRGAAGSGSGSPSLFSLSTVSSSRVIFGKATSQFTVKATEIGGLALTSSE